jgi:hypothetical protein
MQNLYLERLKRMSDDQLVEETNKHGKIMETKSPMSKEEKVRAYCCFRFMVARPDLDPDTKQMLLTALRVLKLL